MIKIAIGYAIGYVWREEGLDGFRVGICDVKN